MLYDTLEEKISRWLSIYPNASIILGGDFNIALNNTLDRSPSMQSLWINPALKCFMDKFDLIDIWRSLHPNSLLYTWSNKDGSRQYCYIAI